MPQIGAHILGLSGPELTPGEAAFFRDAAPWGFILFDRNLVSHEQIQRLAASLREAVGRNAPVLIDQEGGRVQRLRPPLARDWLPPLDHVRRAGPHADRALWLRYRLIAHELSGLGIDVNCVPCLDVAREDTHPFLTNRCLGHDPATVARLGCSAAEGSRAGGVLPVIKHIPGHGRGTVDSHLGLPATDAGKDTLVSVDFAPFRALADAPLAMTAHMVYRSIDEGRAATVSPAVIRAIREEIGFDGLLMTDDLSMEALGGSMEERTRASLRAGCDVILHCNGERPEMEDIATEAGTLGAAALARANAAEAARQTPDPIDIPAAEAELEALLKAGDP